MRNPATGGGAREDQAGGQDRGDPTPRTRKPQGDVFIAAKFAWLEAVACDAELKHSAVRVAVILSSYINRDHGCAWPATATIAEKAGMWRSSACAALDNLIGRGHLDREGGGGRKPGSKEGQSSRYWPLIEGHKLSEYADSKGHKLSDEPGSKAPHTVQISGRKLSENSDTNPFKEPSEGERDSLFAEFWQHYPRKDDVKAARRAFKKAMKEGAKSTDLIAGAMRYAAEREGQPKRFTKLASTWLNAGSWMNEPATGGTPQRQGNGRMSAAEFAERRGEAIEQGSWYED